MMVFLRWRYSRLFYVWMVFFLTSCTLPSDEIPVAESEEQIREAWANYDQNLRTWCTTYHPRRIEACLQEEYQRHGISPPATTATSSTPVTPVSSPSATDGRVRSSPGKDAPPVRPHTRNAPRKK